MGCGSINPEDITSLKHTLFYRTKKRVEHIKNTNNNTLPFFSIDQLSLVETSLLNFYETIDSRSLQNAGGDNHYLLSAQRRALWKLALLNFDPNRKTDETTFTSTPTTTNQKTKQRFYQISLDINRTFTGINFNRNDLSIILQNLSLYFEGVGYTQGMNFIVGFLLLTGFTPKQTHQIFIRLSYHPHFLLIRNFTDKFENVNACIAAMQNIMNNENYPSLKEINAHFQSVGMNLFIFVFSWFLTYFIYTCNVRSCVLIWDYLILQSQQSSEQEQQEPDIGHFGCGMVNLINLALKILASLAQQILRCDGAEPLMNLLRNQSMQVYLSEQTVQAIIKQCKVQPYLSLHTFSAILAEKDKELLSLIATHQITQTLANNAKINCFQQFMHKCRHPQQSPQNVANIKQN